MKLGFMVLFLLMVTVGVGVAQLDLGTDAQIAAGKKLYDQKCGQCHGDTGAGDGVARDYFDPTPRDFTKGLYKIRTTASGELPTHDDLKKVIRDGMPFTGMPPWPHLSDEEIENLTYYLKTFSEDFSDPDFAPTALSIPKPPAITDESIARGKEVYEENKCADCHGVFGRTDGKSAPTLENEWHEPIRPADLTKPWTFRGGSRREDIYRTFTTGLNGTPMPSYADLIEEEDRWHLVNYVASLASREEPDYGTVVVAEAVNVALDLAQGAALFESATPAYFPVIGQIVEPGRNFFPGVNEVAVTAVYNADEIAIRVAWNDMSADSAGTNGPDLAAPLFGEADPGGGPFSDAIAVQIPSTNPPGGAKPYFLFGDGKNSVDLWFVDLARDQGALWTGRGSQALENRGVSLPVSASFVDGEWSVIFKADRHPEDGFWFEEDTFLPIAFSVWDGYRNERGNSRGVTPWYNLYLRPVETASRATPIASYVLLTLLIEVALIQAVRIKHGRPGFSFLSISGAVEESRRLNVDIGFALLGGLVATIAMSIFLYLIMPTMAERPFDIGGMIGDLFEGPWALGVATHFILGALIFPLFFVGYFYSNCPGPAWFKGTVWGGLLWILAETVAIPLTGGGMFHSDAGGMGAAGGFLFGHLIYGGVLGAVTGSSGVEE